MAAETTPIDRAPVRDEGTPLRRVLRRPQFWFGAAVLVPTVLWYLLFAFVPILRGLWIAAADYNVLAPSASRFVGLANFEKLLVNPLLFIAIRNTLLLAVLQFAATLPLALVLATCLTNIRRGTRLYQGLIFLPVVVSLVAVSLLFRMLMDPEVGTFNQILNALGLPTSRWLSSSDTALPTVAAIDVWKNLGFYVMLLTAGMLNIPAELHDAARVDGVNEWQRFRHITLPLLGHTLALVMVLLAIGSLQVFTGPYVLTSGGPAQATYVFNLLIVEEAFANLRFGAAAAAALMQFALILVISLVQLKLIRPKWSY
ncbi:MAG TPA: sugar ABC transporter permease [Chloroflexota bacterium]|jgi:ABC-type sugar transport system permease subunit|nr:sugar ABC transporter permease [Chloroflexota bacterium]